MAFGPIALQDMCTAMEDAFFEKAELYELTTDEGRAVLRTFMVGMLIRFDVIENPDDKRKWKKFYSDEDSLHMDIPDDLSELEE